MNKKLKLFFFFLAVLIIPALCQASVTILSNASPNHTVLSGSDEQIYGTSASYQVTLESGAKAELINFPGQNSIQIQSSSDLFKVSRSGTVVTFERSDGTVLKMPATNSVQTITFADRPPLILNIYEGQVMLDDHIITPDTVIDLLILSGSLLEAGDGAYVYLPDKEPGQLTDLEMSVSADSAGQETDGGFIVSREYSLQLDWQDADGQNLLTAIPLDTSVLGDVSAEALFAVEYLDQISNTWVWLSAMTYLDLQEGMLYVDLPLQKIIQQQIYFNFNFHAGQKNMQSSQNNLYPPVKLRASKFSPRPQSWLSQKKVEFSNSPFVILYHDSGYNAILADAEWNGTKNTHLDSSGNTVPEYIGDLHQALMDTYQALLTLVDGSGNQLFSPRSRITVYVQKMAEAGNASLGGNMQFNIKMEDYQEMLWTAAHEMVHVLQGEYYAVKGLFTGRQNRWFIEATAQYFGALILGLDEMEKAEFYPGSYSGNYLSVPITANNDGSFYLLGHFLDWLSKSYSTCPSYLFRPT
jgi:hypothetical protein